ncbi:nicotinate mononucleotide-dependent phosphoribosyltransferase CobT [Crocosphaera sp. XPORK-15E]|uniref:nicotinate mononucleotide-dependent phosphoribosyltransferase CobT n=1 Tax=Crocosphaera sp. XPORK-15E TaxID=3110247 RepID=UPI002B20EB81|nr:TIGR00303 family protein [Crocosphaera sp. XPORK-15E]MEA5533210.1 TIGR00303 family protein [Crocosphaera sp. XPORK-15E]
MIRIYTQKEIAQKWLNKYQYFSPIFACILGFTETCLIPGISAAGATPEARKYTAIADAEFLINGVKSHYKYPLPPLIEGVSPVFITRAVVESLNIPLYLFNAGLLYVPSVPYLDLGGIPANCLTTGNALPLDMVYHLFQQGLDWGKKLGNNTQKQYLILSECVVGGTTTALAILTGLGIKATGKVNSSHPNCNHKQKKIIVKQGLKEANLYPISNQIEPFKLVASVGDPMQIVVAGMAIAASQKTGVLLAGGTQMLAVYALIKAILKSNQNQAKLDNIVVGTTRWVAEDPTGDTVSLAESIGDVPLLATQLSFAKSSYPQLQVYEQGYVKEGVGAGGAAIAAHLSYNWTQEKLLFEIENLLTL